MMRINAEREEIFRDSLRGKIVSIMSLSAKKGGVRRSRAKRKMKYAYELHSVMNDDAYHHSESSVESESEEFRGD